LGWDSGIRTVRDVHAADPGCAWGFWSGRAISRARYRGVSQEIWGGHL